MITKEVYWHWVRVAAYHIWKDRELNGDPDQPHVNWVAGEAKINAKLEAEGITVNWDA